MALECRLHAPRLCKTIPQYRMPDNTVWFWCHGRVWQYFDECNLFIIAFDMVTFFQVCHAFIPRSMYHANPTETSKNFS